MKSNDALKMQIEKKFELMIEISSDPKNIKRLSEEFLKMRKTIDLADSLMGASDKNATDNAFAFQAYMLGVLDERARSAK
jgi:hypothetical protein